MTDIHSRVLYDDQTNEVIEKRMLDLVDPSIDKREGSIVADLLSPSAMEMAFLYGELANVLDFSFADTTYGAYLDRRCKEVGITRKDATPAVGTVKFTGYVNQIVPLGTLVSTDGANPIEFETDEEVQINEEGTAQVTVTAVTPGIRGNIIAGKIKTLTRYLVGITSVTNETVFDGGSDVESDEDLLKRYYLRMRTPSTSGNVHQYKEWALSIKGIGDCKVFPLWDGNGTVKLRMIDTEKTAPDPTIIEDVQVYIESVRPIGATVTYEAATEVPMNIGGTIVLEPNSTIEQAIEDIQSALKTYLQDLAFRDNVVRISQIQNHILDSPYVLDYSDLTLNAGTGNVLITDGDVAVVGTVSLVAGN
ncbi:MAG: baseplate J/gp47 family protein [Bacillota bacterium]